MKFWNGPNALTALRLALVPLLWWMLFAADINRWLTLLVFLLAALTDYVDGWWARKEQLVTDFGKIADPIADKALTGAAWIGFSILGTLPWAATILIMTREIGITLLRLRMLNRHISAADRGGKIKTTLQIVTISLWLVTPTYQGLIGAFLQLLLWVTVLLTVATGINYLRQLLGAQTK